MEQLEKTALTMRRIIFKTACHAGTGHIAPSLSAVEILTALYFGGVMRYDPKRPEWKERDYLIMSKGHASLALYAALTLAGYIPEKDLENFCSGRTPFGGILKRNVFYGIEASTGSLGQGLCFATGIALANQLDEKENRVYAIVGDGECQEGTVWEAAMNAAHHNLNHLTVIIDHNQLQGMDAVDRIVKEGSLREKWKSFGFEAEEVDGHDVGALCRALRAPGKKPKAIIAHTVKGKGISFMEGVPIWHYRSTNAEETKVALRELGMSGKDLVMA